MTLPATISTARLTLRGLEMNDLEPYVAYYTGDRTGGVGGPKPRFRVVERFHAMAGQWALRGYGRYGIAQGDIAFGHVGIMHMDEADPIEITWTLWDPAYEGQGFATEAANAVLEAWRGPQLIAQILNENTASLAVAQRLSFVEDPSALAPDYAPTMRTFRAPLRTAA